MKHNVITRVLAVLLLATMMLCSFVACNNANDGKQTEETKKEEEKKMRELPFCRRVKASPRVLEEHNYKILHPPQIPVV